MVHAVRSVTVSSSNQDASRLQHSMLCIHVRFVDMLVCAGLAASVGLAETVYGVSANVILDSACRAITSWDIITSCIKSWVFGTIIAVVSSSICLAVCLPVGLQPSDARHAPQLAHQQGWDLVSSAC